MHVLKLRAWVWPLPALLGWCMAWATYATAHALALPVTPALLAAAVVGCAPALMTPTWRRRVIVAAGFPLSAAVLRGADLPSLVWLAALLPLWLVYPLRAWRDAPFFPTGKGALQGLRKLIFLTPRARVLDAGCGLGHGLQALREVWPQVQIEGVEWSRPLALLARLRCSFASVRRGDMWLDDWRHYDVVYLFQRPESMARAASKAQSEMRPGSWLVSLDFAVPLWREHARLARPGQRMVWVYRIAPIN